MTGTQMIQLLLTFTICIIFFGLVWYIYENKIIDKIIETYIFTSDMEECVYDPVVQKLKNIVTFFLDSRKIPWTGRLEVLNNKKKQIMKKLTLCKGESSYTIDKEVTYLCVKDADGKYYDEHMLMHVLLHELAHSINDEIGHSKKFDDIFTELMDEADSPTDPSQSSIYDKSLPLVEDYCGVGKNDTYDTNNP